MAIDNALYSRLADTWWTEDSVLCLLRLHLNPCRFGYFEEVFTQRLGGTLAGKRVLDIGCGGGILSEELARAGCEVTGLDPSEESLVAAREHAAQSGLKIDYVHGFAEQLPFPDQAFDIVCCCDVLEHVQDLGQVIAETNRVLKPGGAYFFDTVNRTFISWLFFIKVAQDWPSTAYMPPNLHEWKMFIRPQELRKRLQACGLDQREFVGMSPNVGPLRVLRDLRRLKRGEINFRDYGASMKIVRSRDLSGSYMGYAVKP